MGDLAADQCRGPRGSALGGGRTHGHRPGAGQPHQRLGRAGGEQERRQQPAGTRAWLGGGGRRAGQQYTRIGAAKAEAIHPEHRIGLARQLFQTGGHPQAQRLEIDLRVGGLDMQAGRDFAVAQHQ